MKLSNFMIGILSIVVAAYILIGITEQMTLAKSSYQGWHNLQVRRVGKNKFEVRHMQGVAVIVLQENKNDVGTVQTDIFPSTAQTRPGSHTGSYTYTASGDFFQELGRRDQSTESQSRSSRMPGR